MMLASDKFIMRISPIEKAMLAEIAKHFQRTQAGALKTYIRREYEAIKIGKAERPGVTTETLTQKGMKRS